MPDSAPRPLDDEKWENLLRQWRTQPNSQPRPFFYSRVRARLVRESSVERQPLQTWLRWPGYGVMLAVILLLSGDGPLPRPTEPANQSQPYPSGLPAAVPAR